ncbi:hypothetical protein Bbelb_191170 [Branchiostoma belcheri]|nr:hypothetical protein Bbelb_191170 [Branchiostoma belcheri]
MEAVKDNVALQQAFIVNPLYLRHENSGQAVDYMHWQIPLSRRFRALKLWFVIRSYGVRGLRDHVRKGVRLAEMFETMVRKDTRFEIPAQRILGLVVFRLKVSTPEVLQGSFITGRVIDQCPKHPVKLSINAHSRLEILQGETCRAYTGQLFGTGSNMSRGKFPPPPGNITGPGRGNTVSTKDREAVNIRDRETQAALEAGTGKRSQGPDSLTETLLNRLNKTGKLFMVPASLKGKYIIRFTVTSQNTAETDIVYDFELIQKRLILSPEGS